MFVVAGVLVFQAEDGIRDLVRSRGLGDVYKRQNLDRDIMLVVDRSGSMKFGIENDRVAGGLGNCDPCLLYTSDAADERSSVDLGGRRIIKKKKTRRLGV